MPDHTVGYAVIDIATPKEELLCWTPGHDQQVVAEQAGKYNITYIPVTTNGRITGLVTRSSLESDPEPNVRALTADWLVTADTPILKVIELFANHPERVFLVLQASEIVGLVAPADLNKTHARASIYLLLAQFEAALGRLIRRVLPDDADYCKYLSEERLNKIRDQRQATSQQDMELDLLEFMHITDLTTIAQKAERIRDLLQFGTPTQAKKHMSITKVRNAVSHPIEPLISSRQEFEKLHDVCSRLFDLNTRIASAHHQLDTQSA